MTGILSWNIQNGRGIDGTVSLARIASVVATMGSPDVVCLQEVSRGLTLGDDDGEPDQIAELSDLFPEYDVVFGAAVDVLCTDSNARWQFGNAVLVRLPLLSVLSHPLPKPGVGGKRCMMRQATEVVVDRPAGPLRIVNVHLEYHSDIQRMAQVARLRDLQREALEESKSPPRVDAVGPYQSVPRPVDSVLCGDFNMLSGSEEYRALRAPLTGETDYFHDAWELAHPDRPHDPTCGIHDRVQWPEGPHCRDFFFVAGTCVGEVRDVRVDTTSSASDHQPLMLELAG